MHFIVYPIIFFHQLINFLEKSQPDNRVNLHIVAKKYENDLAIYELIKIFMQK